LRLEYGVGIDSTETMRWAMYKSPQGFGLNAQTLPKALRYYLTAPDGRIFCGGDLSQAEARAVAYQSICRDLIDLFNDSKRHIHSENAVVVFGHPVEKDSPEYVLAKAVVHASNYREGPHRFSVQAGIPVSRARELLETYHGKRPEIRVWHDWVWNQIKTKGSLTTPLGDGRIFYEAISCFSLTGKMSDQQWKDAIAWCPQTLVPHILNLGLIEMKRWQNDGMDLWFHHQGHDSFLVSVPIGEERDFFERVSRVYSGIRIPSPGGLYNIPTEYTSGFSFGDMFNYRGDTLSCGQWQGLVDKKLQKKPREADIITGTLGVHLRDWRL
jgi:hypothetical protein